MAAPLSPMSPQANYLNPHNAPGAPARPARMPQSPPANLEASPELHGRIDAGQRPPLNPRRLQALFNISMAQAGAQMDHELWQKAHLEGGAPGR